MPSTPPTLHFVIFDTEGRFTDRAAVDALIAGAGAPSDVFIVSHGWNNSFADAQESYLRLRERMTDVADQFHLRPPGFNPLLLGVIWPSKALDDSGLESFSATSTLLESVPETLSPRRTSADEYLRDVPRLMSLLASDRRDKDARRQVLELLRRYAEPAAMPEEEGAFDTADVGGLEGMFDNFSVRDVYRAFTYWQMKKRAGVVGRKGVSELVKAVQQRMPAARVHLVGHSFGTKVVLAAVAAADLAPIRPVQTLVLLQGAVSHEALADRVSDTNQPGGYRAARDRQRVSGVIAATFSVYDRALNSFYPLGSKLGGHTGELEGLEALVAFKYSALGGVGAHDHGAPMGRRSPVRPVGESYGFAPGDLWSLDGGPPRNFIAGHSEIRTREIAWLIWSAVLAHPAAEPTGPESAMARRVPGVGFEALESVPPRPAAVPPVVSATGVPFIGNPTRALTISGFESMGGPSSPSKESAPSPAQNARATDLFLRGVLTPEELARARASRAGFEMVIDRSNFLPAVFLEIGASVSRCTCLVRTSGVDFLGRSGSWSGTGFLIGPNMLVTNNHVLNSKDVAAAANCVFNYQTGMDGQPLSTRTFRLRPERLFLTSPARGGLDYTFVWIDGDPASEFGIVRVSREAFAIAENEFANVISHPAGRMKEISLQENEVQWQDDMVVHYTSDTEPGSSGASVCNNNWLLVALHHASKPSNVPNYTFLNEGIKLSAIAADLERLASGTTSEAATARELLTVFGGTDERLGFFGTLGRRAPAGSGLEAVVNTFQGTEQDIDVGFWNVEWLTKHYEEKRDAVAKVIHGLNLDVWSLEESSPNAAAALVEELQSTYGLKFGHAAAEPASSDGKQSCTLLWNKDTVDVVAEEWGEPIETWLRTRSTDFDDLNLGGFEAIHGKIFDRYPALFKVTAKQSPNGENPFAFYLVPLHLKAMEEGSLRRKMAAKILAEAVKKKIEDGAGEDWVLGGDANAELETGDFANLTNAGLAAISAGDEQDGAFSYIKAPHKSLIDHIFLSPNLANRVDGEDFFIVAAEKTFPHYVAEISDHRPVLVRLSLATGTSGNGGLESLTTKADPAALTELKVRLAATGMEDGFEAKKKKGPKPPTPSADGRKGYRPDFLGHGHQVTLPGLSAALASKAVTVNRQGTGIDKFTLQYTHFSVVMNGERRMPFYSAVNIDGNQLQRVAREGSWFLDSRIPSGMQVGDEAYRSNDLDKGHMTRRLDPVWGSRNVAESANKDTFCYTNACPQHKDLNQKEWLQLEDYVLDNAGAHDLKLCVMTGPVFRTTDRPYRSVLLPEEFWKVVVMVKSGGNLSATGYVLSQRDMISGFEAEFAFGPFRTYQVPIRRIAELTGLDFAQLPNFDPFVRPRRRPGPEGGFESVTAPAATVVTGPESLVL